MICKISTAPNEKTRVVFTYKEACSQPGIYKLRNLQYTNLRLIVCKYIMFWTDLGLEGHLKEITNEAPAPAQIKNGFLVEANESITVLFE